MLFDCHCPKTTRVFCEMTVLDTQKPEAISHWFILIIIKHSQDKISNMRTGSFLVDFCSIFESEWKDPPETELLLQLEQLLSLSTFTSSGPLSTSSD